MMLETQPATHLSTTPATAGLPKSILWVPSALSAFPRTAWICKCLSDWTTAREGRDRVCLTGPYVLQVQPWARSASSLSHSTNIYGKQHWAVNSTSYSKEQLGEGRGGEEGAPPLPPPFLPATLPPPVPSCPIPGAIASARKSQSPCQPTASRCNEHATGSLLRPGLPKAGASPTLS